MHFDGQILGCILNSDSVYWWRYSWINYTSVQNFALCFKICPMLPYELELFAWQALGFASLTMHSRFCSAPPGMQNYFALVFQIPLRSIWNAAFELHGFASLAMHPIWSCAPAGMQKYSASACQLELCSTWHASGFTNFAQSWWDDTGLSHIPQCNIPHNEFAQTKAPRMAKIYY